MKLGLKQLFGTQDMERRIIALYTLGAIVITLIFSAMIAIYGAKGLGLALFVVACNNLPVLRLLQKKQNTQKASFYLISNGAFTLTFSISFVGGLEGPVSYWVGILPLGGGLLLHRQGIVLGTILAFVAVVVLAVGRSILGISDVLIPDAAYRAISLACFISLISFMSYLYLQKNAIVVADQTRKLDNLLNIVAHDIANPLTLISGHAELLIAQGQANAPQKKALTRIARASELINQILRKVRQIQAAKAGKLSIQSGAVGLADIFDKLRFVFENRLQQKQQQLHIDLPAAFQAIHVQAEPVMLLNEVLSNLVSNAIKFSPIGSTIAIRVAREQDFMRIEVRDQGIGIPRELIPHIFDDFRSTSRPGTEGEAGTGFGLPLARHIVEAFGGSLHVDGRSADDQRQNAGSTFILMLPIHREATAQAQAS